MSDAGRALVIAAVRAVVPALRPGDGFVCVDDAGGGSKPLEAYADIARRFQIQTQDFQQGEIASATPVQWEEGWEIVVSYPKHWGDDGEALTRTVLSDMRQIIAAVQPPSAWSAALSNLHVGHAPVTLSPVPGANGETIAFHAALPVRVEYFATP